MSTDLERMTIDVKDFNNWNGWKRSSKQSDVTSQTAFMIAAQVKWTKVWFDWQWLQHYNCNADDEL